MSENDSVIVEIAKNHRGDDSSLVLSSGVRARVVPVAAGIIEEAQAALKPPPIPKWYNEDKGREEENPGDPAYLEALRELDQERTRIALDIIVMFGVVLLDEDGNEVGAPSDDHWIKKIQWMEKRGSLDLSGLDFEDEMDREFAYKKYIAVLAPDMQSVLRMSGFGEEDVQDALASFPDNETRRPNSKRRTKRGN